MAQMNNNYQINGIGSGGASGAAIKKVKEALELLSPDQSGALKLAGKVNENEKKLSELCNIVWNHGILTSYN